MWKPSSPPPHPLIVLRTISSEWLWDACSLGRHSVEVQKWRSNATILTRPTLHQFNLSKNVLIRWDWQSASVSHFNLDRERQEGMGTCHRETGDLRTRGHVTPRWSHVVTLECHCGGCGCICISEGLRCQFEEQPTASALNVSTHCMHVTIIYTLHASSSMHVKIWIHQCS